uniref:Disease resistance R13L4/SHOC-2-like LRR domain-containing protein n=1 Tax=Fagus sylvatica TaxID=28930 RepID=A0A2N9HSA1_FAGSY
MCQKLKKLPRDIQKLVSLKHLEIDGCESLTHMPYGIGQLTSLQTLPLFVVSKDLKASSSKHCGGLAELNKLNNLRARTGQYQLQAFARDNGDDDEYVSNFFTSLLFVLLPSSLQIKVSDFAWNIQDVESLPEELLKNLASLQRLHISDCPNLTSLPEGIGNLTSLQSLDISDCPNLTSLPEGIGNLTSLQRLRSLDISNCPNLTSLPEGIGNLTSLLRLRIYECPNLTSLPEGIGNLTSLQSLDISDCPNLTSLPEGIGNLTSLQFLKIYKCHNLTSIPEGYRQTHLPTNTGNLELSPLEGKMPGGNWRGLA